MKLTDKSLGQNLWRGTAFRVPNFDGYGLSALLMIWPDPEDKKKLMLVHVGGYHTCDVFLRIPDEALLPGKDISRSWLVKNWTKWVCERTNIENVEVFTDLLEALPATVHAPSD